ACRCRPVATGARRTHPTPTPQPDPATPAASPSPRTAAAGTPGRRTRPAGAFASHPLQEDLDGPVRVLSDLLGLGALREQLVRVSIDVLEYCVGHCPARLSICVSETSVTPHIRHGRGVPTEREKPSWIGLQGCDW